MQIRVGDIALLSENKGGITFFGKLKKELDDVLSTLFPVHFYFFAEAPTNGTTEPNKNAPPPGFEFLPSIFHERAQLKADSAEDPNKLVRQAQRVSFVNDMAVQATLYHEMNADMVITTGSSFPLVGVTISPKVRHQ
jgi:hypothetical protein